MSWRLIRVYPGNATLRKFSKPVGAEEGDELGAELTVGAVEGATETVGDNVVRTSSSCLEFFVAETPKPTASAITTTIKTKMAR